MSVNVGGNLTGNILGGVFNPSRPNPLDNGIDSADVANWLWRQGSGTVNTGGQAQPTAWWINFGSYTANASKADAFVGFTGFGTLGGGDVDVQVGGDAGVLRRMDGNPMSASANPRSQGLVLAVGSTGRVAGDGSLQLTGGGDLRVRIGGALNPGSVVDVNDQNGQLVNIRGNVQLQSATTGRIDLTYGSNSSEQSPGETRAFDPFQATRGRAVGASPWCRGMPHST